MTAHALIACLSIPKSFAVSPRIVCAALRHRETKRIICGPRHFDPIMRGQIAAEADRFVRDCWKYAEQGFVDQFGKFYTRQQAWVVADANKQIVRPLLRGTSPALFPEELY